jgi:hypothetical protein
MNLSDFTLLKEDANSYTIGHPQGKSMVIPKSGLSPQAHTLIKKLRREQSFAEGTPEGTEDAALPINPNPGANKGVIGGEEPVHSTLVSGPDLNRAPYKPFVTEPEDEEIQAQPPISPASAEPPSPATPPQADLLPQNKKSLEDASAQMEQARQQSVAAGKSMNFQQEATVKNADSIFQDNMKKDADLFKAYQDKTVDPDRFWKSRDTGSKISSSIGLILSGIGSAMTGQPNMAMQNINRAIENDIDAQKNDQSQALNLWKMNRQHTQDDIQATLMTQNQYLNAAKFKIDQAGASTNNALAQGNLAQSKAAIDQQLAVNNWMRSRMDNHAAPGTEQDYIGNMQAMQVLRPEFFKDMQDKYIPGVGKSRLPLSPQNKQAFQAYDEMQKAVDDAKAFQAELPGYGTLPFSANSDVAESKRNAIALAMNKLNGLNRLNETELKAFNGMIGKLGSMQSGRANAQLDELSNQIARKKKSEMDSLAVVPFQKSSTNEQARAWLKQNPGDPRAAQVQQMLGGL